MSVRSPGGLPACRRSVCCRPAGVPCGLPAAAAACSSRPTRAAALVSRPRGRHPRAGACRLHCSCGCVAAARPCRCRLPSNQAPRRPGRAPPLAPAVGDYAACQLQCLQDARCVAWMHGMNADLQCAPDPVTGQVPAYDNNTAFGCIDKVGGRTAWPACPAWSGCAPPPACLAAGPCPEGAGQRAPGAVRRAGVLAAPGSPRAPACKRRAAAGWAQRVARALPALARSQQPSPAHDTLTPAAPARHQRLWLQGRRLPAVQRLLQRDRVQRRRPRAARWVPCLALPGGLALPAPASSPCQPCQPCLPSLPALPASPASPATRLEAAPRLLRCLSHGNQLQQGSRFHPTAHHHKSVRLRCFLLRCRAAYTHSSPALAAFPAPERCERQHRTHTGKTRCAPPAPPRRPECGRCARPY